jgi:hypothetical protein
VTALLFAVSTRAAQAFFVRRVSVKGCKDQGLGGRKGFHDKKMSPMDESLGDGVDLTQTMGYTPPP